MAKLTTNDVQSIRGYYALGVMSRADLARQHKVSWSTINAIIKRKTWGHVR